MVSTCSLSRLLSGGAMGFLGASPFHNTVAEWIGAGVGVAAVYTWSTWLGHASACDVAAGPPREDVDADSSSVGRIVTRTSQHGDGRDL